MSTNGSGWEEDTFQPLTLRNLHTFTQQNGEELVRIQSSGSKYLELCVQ